MLRALALALLAAAPAAAEDLSGAVLRLGGAADRPNCTAVLIAPGAALTAAHCARGAPVTLQAGWRDGTAVQTRRGADPRRPRLEPRMENRHHADQARLALDAPFAGLAPARPGPAPPAGASVTVISHPRGAPGPETATCRVLARPGTEILLDCPARSGMSGAPLFRDGRLVGLLTHSVDGGRSLATALSPDLMD